MIRHSAVPAALLLLAACGKSDESALEDAANQSDPAAAEILNGAAQNGMNPQDALEQAGQAAAANQNAAGGPPSGSVQARPNLPGSPNRPDGTQPPDKMAVGQNKTGIAGDADPKLPPQ